MWIICKLPTDLIQFQSKPLQAFFFFFCIYRQADSKICKGKAKGLELKHFRKKYITVEGITLSNIKTYYKISTQNCVEMVGEHTHWPIEQIVNLEINPPMTAIRFLINMQKQLKGERVSFSAN